VNVDSFRFLPRSFRPFYEGRGPFPGEDAPVWAPFDKRLKQSRIALLTSAGIYVQGSQEPFDTEGERANPEWGDPTWRAIPGTAKDLGFAHLHINPEDMGTDPEIALPSRLLSTLAEEGVIGSTTTEHVSVMGFQERSLKAWKETTAPQIVAWLRDQSADGMILAPA
jgi:D-proline reductase (dithiol) PrdB